MSEGWKCPVCGRGVAPSEKTCDHGALDLRSPDWQRQFYPPLYPPPKNPWSPPTPTRTGDPWRPPYEITCGSVESVSAGVLWNRGVVQNAGSA